MVLLAGSKFFFSSFRNLYEFVIRSEMEHAQCTETESLLNELEAFERAPEDVQAILRYRERAFA